MKIPTTIADQELLGDEPFVGHFWRQMQKKEQPQTRSIAKPTRLTRKDFVRHDAMEAARAWVNMAFDMFGTGPNDTPSAVEQITNEHLRIFEQFFWRVFMNQDALGYLRETLESHRKIGARGRAPPSLTARKRPRESRRSEERQKNKLAKGRPKASRFDSLKNVSPLPVSQIQESPDTSQEQVGETTLHQNVRPLERRGPSRPVSSDRGDSPIPPRDQILSASARTQSKTLRIKGKRGAKESSIEQDQGPAPSDHEPPPPSRGESAPIPNAGKHSTTPSNPEHPTSPVTRSRKGYTKKPAHLSRRSGEVDSQVAKRQAKNNRAPTPMEPVHESTVGRRVVLPESRPLATVQGVTEALRGSRKRNREETRQAITAEQPLRSSSSNPSRPIAPLPKATGLVAAPLAPPPLKDTPRTPGDVDSIIRNAASAALLADSQGLGAPASDWEEEVEVDELLGDEVPQLFQALKISGEEQNASLAGQDATVACGDGLVAGTPVAVPPGGGNVDTSAPVYIYPKPPLPGYPPIWAQSRQEVCESFDWFRSYQGGVYFSGDMVKGYLLGGFSASRDIFQHRGKLIVSHGGGRAESSVNKTAASDQLLNDKSVRALLNTMKLNNPLVLIVDDQYALFPFSLASRGCGYAVLGLYRIAYAWAEKQYAPGTNNQVVRYKFAFQWCDSQGDPWWWNETTPTGGNGFPLLANIPPESTPVPPTPPLADCAYCCRCTKQSRQVYEQGWMCLNAACSDFFMINGSDAPSSLTYSESFLLIHPIPPGPRDPTDIRPKVPTITPEDGITTSRLFRKGWYCEGCGRLSCRFKWEHWECRNCQARGPPPGKARHPMEFRRQLEAKGFLRHKHAPESGIIRRLTGTYNYGTGFASYVTFVLPQDRGLIHVIFSAPLSSAEADNIFMKYQEQANSGELEFPQLQHKCRGTLLTNYFSQNTGAPYQYVGGADHTVPWERAPSSVFSALNLIKTRMKQALNKDGEFNEVLSAGYMEKQKMSYHSDAERGLGGTVASLSLGASAYMHFRLHSHYANELPAGSSREVLSLYLRHGDVVVMEGLGVQKCYEHTVVPLNFRIAATARLIDSSNYSS